MVYHFDEDGNFIEAEGANVEGSSLRTTLQSPYEPRKLPTIETMLSVPVEFLLRNVHVPSEACVMLQLGDLGADLDLLFEHIREQTSDYFRCHDILKETVRQSLTNSLYITESVTRNTAKAGIKANLVLLNDRVHDVLRQMESHLHTLRLFAEMNAILAQECDHTDASAMGAMKRQILEVENLLIKRVHSIVAADIQLDDWCPVDIWPDFVYNINSQATSTTQIPETEQKVDESQSSSSSLYAATRHRDDTPFDDNPVVG
ncbi:Aste57867_20933 [Aphanomyces stellatus]|uniref:Aste57867_20933 protein n=1 Tax=Aphanomyces stellatus TaxID=120398 RepID=A0A485LGU4_9STRA|nr:hypothetical protein As57867_020865 [Aphanomyces stellatus]VFT97610.1 Aste57867_20933 [Aphanomyces stellatus]